MLTKKMGDIMVPQIHIACWTRVRVFSGWGNRCAELWWGKFQLEELGTWPFMVKGCQHWVFLDNETWPLKGFQCSSSCYVLVLRICGEGQETLVPDAAGGQSSSVHAWAP